MHQIAGPCHADGVRRVICAELGPPETLRLEDVPSLEPHAGQVVIDVEAAGVNFVDVLFIAGQYQIKPPLPFTPGSEVAGTVVAVGEGVEGWEVGARVLANCGLGGYAEQVAVAPIQVVRVPDSLTAAQAAAFAQSYCTAMFALRERAGLRAGETVLILGAGGGVGLAAIDVACLLGANVIAAASSEAKRAAARRQGANAVIDYLTEDVKLWARELSGGGVDVVVDPVGGPTAEAALRALREFGRYLVIGFAAGEIPRLPLNQVLLRNRSIVGVDWGAWSLRFPTENAALLRELLGLAAEGRLHPQEPTVYPMEDVARALVDLRDRKVTGKVVLRP
ncbi:MAG: NADPH:quinone oxidoreductase family protein [Acidimicrobiales bacterium]|nr:NADPH:quinone oxidoreductase family protein [Acidimicrobiales bacterium]